jgi:hypothetical protein
MAEYNLPQLHPDLQPYLQDGELHHPRLRNGISWTIERNIALQYALGWHKNSQISTGIISKKSVIAVIDRWHESEVIVPTRLVREIDTQTATPRSI